MRYLLDTNVLSEPLKRSPDPRVLRWLEAQSPLDLAISALTVGEIVAGVHSAAEGRREQLERWVVDEIPRQFASRILHVDAPIAAAWGRLVAEGRATGRELLAIDGLLLATCEVHQLTFVTRNERDCAGRGIQVLNPCH